MKQEVLKVGWKCKDNKRQVPITGCWALKVAKDLCLPVWLKTSQGWGGKANERLKRGNEITA